MPWFLRNFDMEWFLQIPMTIIFTKCDKRKKKKNGGKRPEENVSDFHELISGFFQTTPPWIMTSSVTHQGRDEILLHIAQLRNYWLKHWKSILPTRLPESTRYNILSVMLVLVIHKGRYLSKISVQSSYPSTRFRAWSTMTANKSARSRVGSIENESWIIYWIACTVWQCPWILESLQSNSAGKSVPMLTLNRQ